MADLPQLDQATIKRILNESPMDRIRREAAEKPPWMGNGTCGEVRTTEVRARPPGADEAERKQKEALRTVAICANGAVGCAFNHIKVTDMKVDASAQYGPVKGGIHADNKGLDADLNIEKKSSKKIEIKAQGMVCIQHKDGTEDGKGSWKTIKGKILGYPYHFGFPDGKFCIGTSENSMSIE